MSYSESKLFTPLPLGDIVLSHRIVMAPMTRMRANEDFVLEDVTVQYYSQRSSLPGTLIISEAAVIAAEGMAFSHVPGIYNEAQIAAWKKVVDAVHANGSFIFLQITAGGRMAYPELLRSHGFPYVCSSPVQLKSRSEAPVELSEADVKRYIGHYAQAARKAIHMAGFDGVEIHGCNGGLMDQFIQDVVNKRTDSYGGSVENRSRFALEVIEAVAKAVGEKRVGVRLSPWTKGQGELIASAWPSFRCLSYLGMGMRNPIPTYSYIISQLAKGHSDLAYIHMIEPGIESITEGMPQELDEGTLPSNDFAFNLWRPRVYMTGGGYKPHKAYETAEKLENTAISIGRMFISNPDLPLRVYGGHELTISDSSTHYSLGPQATNGYIDYPLSPMYS